MTTSSARVTHAGDRTASAAGAHVLDSEVGAPLTPDVAADRLAAVRSAVGSVELEGLTVDAATIADMERVARGELTFDDARAAILARIAAEGREDRAPEPVGRGQV